MLSNSLPRGHSLFISVKNGFQFKFLKWGFQFTDFHCVLKVTPIFHHLIFPESLLHFLDHRNPNLFFKKSVLDSETISCM